MQNYNLLYNGDKILSKDSKSFIDAVHAEQEFIATKSKEDTKRFWQEYLEKCHSA